MPSNETPPPVAADQSPDALAHAYAIEWQKADLSDYVELHGLLERLIRDVRAAERARIAKIVCSQCRDGVPFKNHATHLQTTPSGAEFQFSCSAAAFKGPADER